MDTPRRNANAADPAQVRGAARRVRRQEERERADLVHVAGTIAGRRFLMRCLDRCHIHETVWDPSVRIHFNAGEQNIGLWLMAQIHGADAETLFTMMREKDAEARREQQEAEGDRTPSATRDPEPEGETV